MKRWIAWLVAACLCTTLFACGKNEKGTATLLSEYMAEVGELPAGEIYRSDVAAGENGYFSPSLMAVMYGEQAATHCFPLIEEYAIYLSSFAEPCEIAVFRCYAKSDADRIAEMCLSRTELLRILFAGTPHRARVDAATVRVDGRLVMMCVLP